MSFPGSTMVKNLPVSAGDARDMSSVLGLRKITWSRKWQPTPVFLLVNSIDRGASRATLHVITKNRIQ